LVFWKITRLLRWPKASRYKVSADHFKKSKPVRSRMKMNPRPDTAATYAGTRARRAAIPPYNTGLMVTACTTSGRKRRYSRHKENKVAASCKGFFPLRDMGTA